MGVVIPFSKESLGCKGCVNLKQCGKGLWVCVDQEYSDGSTIYPIENGKRSDGWGACQGDAYTRIETIKQYRKCR